MQHLDPMEVQMSEPFAGVCIVGIVVGVAAICITCFGAMYFERRLRLRVDRKRLKLEIEAQETLRELPK